MTLDERELIALLGRWVSAHPTANAPESCAAVADDIAVRLRALGFAVARHAMPGRAPLLVATRAAAPGAPTVGIYGHYDVEPAGDGWSGDPLTLRVTHDRIIGRGVADNLGPLALRLLAARSVRRWPGVYWVIEGGEEVGSPSLAEYLDGPEGAPEVAVWLDETGYFVDRATQRVLTLHPDERAVAMREALEAHARAAGVRVVCDARRLRRVSPPNVAAVERLFGGAPYLALGPNDADSRVHGADESIPRGTLALCAAQFVAVLETAAGGEA